MIELHILRLIADWLADSTTGINAHLASLDYDGSDAAPSNVTVVDETRSGKVARREFTNELSGEVWVYRASAYTWDAGGDNQGRHDTPDLDVAIHYFDRTAVSETGMRNDMYVHGAIMKSLRNLQQGSTAARTRNTAQLLRLASFRREPTAQTEDGVIVAGALVVTVQARETNPTQPAASP